MEYAVVSLAALAASALTLFSGFGLGTLLMPVVAIFFPLEVAIALTAMVHLANNIFKVGLLGRHANGSVLIRFGLPAIAAAFLGALLLTWLSDIPAVYRYAVGGHELSVSPLKLVVGVLILAFVLLELSPRFSAISLDRKYLPFGGIVSGFFGGLSGHQGAFRSMFLLKAGLAKEEFVATGVMLAVMVDLSRMTIYGWDMLTQSRALEWPLVIAASLSAFTGAYVGAKVLKKVTIRSIQLMVSALLVVVSLGLVSGLL
jgi:uncharacterized membrane protein YfcA